MELRKVFTLDPDRFPLEKVREVVEYLHDRDQHYIVMVDPAVAYQNYSAYSNGVDLDVWLKYDNGTIYEGVVWPGPTVFPDWFHPNVEQYWNDEFVSFFSAESGVDIDGLWIDMNEAANFCNWPCADPAGFAEENKNPPDPPALRDGSAVPLPGFPANLQPGAGNMTVRRQALGTKQGLPDRELVDPPYSIMNAAGSLSNKTINTELHHANGLVEYDTHNPYGTMMSSASRTAMLARRPLVRPLVITRSTYLGAGTHVGHWTGDNAATWEQYHLSISDMLNFNSIFQVPMVGSDVCGFSGNTTETLCARWATLGAFYPFYRNHNELGAIGQEFYRWESVARAARNAIEIRYRMLDYFYTQFYLQTQSGKPSLNPLWFIYPHDSNTFANYAQFFFGDAVLVSPVIEENSTSVEIYIPDDIFYDWNAGFLPVRGNGSTTTLDDVDYTVIPLHIKGGSIMALRMQSANTTTSLPKIGFEIVVAPGLDGTANGTLYLDDGDSLEQQATTLVNFTYNLGIFQMTGDYSYDAGVQIESILVLGVDTQPGNVTGAGGNEVPYSYNEQSKVLSVNVTIPLTGDAAVSVGGQGSGESGGPGPYSGLGVCVEPTLGRNTLLLAMLGIATAAATL